MSGPIVIRWSESENALRSTGEPAGVIVLAFPDRSPSFAIDRGWEPHTTPPGTTAAELFEDGISPLAEPLETDVAVAACFGKAELKHLYGLGAQTFHAAIQVLLGAQEFDVMRELVDFIENLASLIDERLRESEAEA